MCLQLRMLPWCLLFCTLRLKIHHYIHKRATWLGLGVVKVEINSAICCFIFRIKLSIIPSGLEIGHHRGPPVDVGGDGPQAAHGLSKLRVLSEDGNSLSGSRNLFFLWTGKVLAGLQPQRGECPQRVGNGLGSEAVLRCTACFINPSQTRTACWQWAFPKPFPFGE